jgi:hypothetical protein
VVLSPWMECMLEIVWNNFRIPPHMSARMDLNKVRRNKFFNIEIKAGALCNFDTFASTN